MSLGFGQRALGLFTCRDFCGQGCLDPLQATVGGRSRGGGTTMGRRFMRLIASENGDRDITVLDKSPAMQPAVEAVAEAPGLFDPIMIRPMALPLAEQTERFAHL